MKQIINTAPSECQSKQITPDITSPSYFVTLIIFQNITQMDVAMEFFIFCQTCTWCHVQPYTYKLLFYDYTIELFGHKKV